MLIHKNNNCKIMETRMYDIEFHQWNDVALLSIVRDTFCILQFNRISRNGIKMQSKFTMGDLHKFFISSVIFFLYVLQILGPSGLSK